MFENREKIRFIKTQLKLFAQYRKLNNFNERKKMALSMGTSKEYFLNPSLKYKELSNIISNDKTFAFKSIDSRYITLLHIYYNQLRETNRFHLGSKEKDEVYFNTHKWKFTTRILPIINMYEKELINA